MINYTAISQLFTTEIIQHLVVQNGHNLQVGNVIYYTGTLYARAYNNTQLTAQTIGIVSNVVDVNQFYVTQAGFLPILPGPYVPGGFYYLDGSGNPGGLTLTPPVASGTWVVPLFVAITNTSGYYFNNAGRLNTPGGTSFTWQTITANQTLAANNGYWVNGVGALNNLRLPVTMMVGDRISVWDLGGNGFTITEQAGQSILLGNNVTTVTTGTIVSAIKGNRVDLTCQTANTFLTGTASGIVSAT